MYSKEWKEALWDKFYMALSRFSSGLFRAILALKEIRNGNQIHRRISA
jgi:hypothetical protein